MPEISEKKKSSIFFFRRRIMKRWESSETRFPKVWRLCEPCSRGKRSRKVFEFVFSFVLAADGTWNRQRSWSKKGLTWLSLKCCGIGKGMVRWQWKPQPLWGCQSQYPAINIQTANRARKCSNSFLFEAEWPGFVFLMKVFCVAIDSVKCSSKSELS